MLDTLRGEGVICMRREVDHKRELDQQSCGAQLTEYISLLGIMIYYLRKSCQDNLKSQGQSFYLA